MTELAPIDRAVLGPDLRSRFVANCNGLRQHILEAGFEPAGRPLVLLLHGFPELAYSWRKIMPALAARGYHVVAPDQRGYGRTTGWHGAFSDDPGPCAIFNLVRDVLGLVRALGHRSVAAVIGHDFGSPVAGWSALIRPDVFRAVGLMSAPFAGPPPLTVGEGGSGPAAGLADADIHRELAGLTPPRKHYQLYYSGPDADGDMSGSPQGLAAFLRAYFHVKSADWPGNRPEPLAGWRARELARLPRYYVMDAGKGMAETVAADMPSPAECRACRWLTESELAVFATEFGRTGFQGGLQWYRCATDPAIAGRLDLFAGRSIDVPAWFIAGRQDWGVYQKPGEFEAMQTRGCTDLRGCTLVDGAGHWVQQEQPEAVADLLLRFLAEIDGDRPAG